MDCMLPRTWFYFTVLFLQLDHDSWFSFFILPLSHGIYHSPVTTTTITVLLVRWQFLTAFMDYFQGQCTAAKALCWHDPYPHLCWSSCFVRSHCGDYSLVPSRAISCRLRISAWLLISQYFEEDPRSLPRQFCYLYKVRLSLVRIIILLFERHYVCSYEETFVMNAIFSCFKIRTD